MFLNVQRHYYSRGGTDIVFEKLIILPNYIILIICLHRGARTSLMVMWCVRGYWRVERGLRKGFVRKVIIRMRNKNKTFLYAYSFVRVNVRVVLYTYNIIYIYVQQNYIVNHCIIEIVRDYPRPGHEIKPINVG